MTTYGEIVEPVSRTAWEDWDDTTSEVNSSRYNKLAWQTEFAAPEVIDTLLVLEGKYLNDCVKSQAECKLVMVNTIKEVSVSLYKMDKINNYICVIKDYNILHSSEIVELLKPYICVSTDVIAIQTKPLSEYQSFELTSQSCFIRTVCTTKPSNPDVNYPKLEQPNIISGVSAGVICLREHLNLCGKAVVCYIEHPEEYQVEAIQVLLKKLGLIFNVNSRQTNVLNSNLYI